MGKPKMVSRLEQFQERVRIRDAGQAAREEVAQNPPTFKIRPPRSRRRRRKKRERNSGWGELSLGVRLERGNQCESCRRKVPEVHLQCHHVLSVSKHKQHEMDPENLLCLCTDCHEIAEGKKGNALKLYASLPAASKVRLCGFLMENKPSRKALIKALDC